jgi:hypothetical protein
MLCWAARLTPEATAQLIQEIQKLLRDSGAGEFAATTAAMENAWIALGLLRTGVRK